MRSREMAEYCVALFHTTSAAFAAEKALVKAGLDCKLIPTPRRFSSDCGISLRFDVSCRDGAVQILEAARVETAGVRQL